MRATELAAIEDIEHMPVKINSVVVGKDILDLLAGGMYVDPLNVYREYIQNSADAIDEAKEAGILRDNGQVQIWMDLSKRRAVIRDNGIGISKALFSKLLTNIGASHKRGKKLRGFRGVGRLSGLGYCQELIFRSKSQTDDSVYEMRWNGRELRNLLRDPSFQGGLAEAVQSIVTIGELSSDGFPERFFEVEMNKISRLKNDLLLNEERVRNYLAQVAPVPFSSSFAYGREIRNFLEAYGIREPINITINDCQESITHNLRNEFAGRNGSVEQVHGVEFIECSGFDGETAAIGWVCNQTYSGAIPRSTGLGGIRLRAGNIQIGEETILAGFFPEPRLNSWAIGEINIISSKVLPNGRRDDFEPSVHYAHLQGEFSLLANSISHQIRERSIFRNHLRTNELQVQELQRWVNALSDQNLPQPLYAAIRGYTMDLLNRADVSIRKLKEKTQSDERTHLKVCELETAVGNINVANEQGRGLRSTYNPMLQAVTRVIIENSKTPQEGVALALKVIEIAQRAA